MKNIKLILITALVVFSLVFSACPPLEEDDFFDALSGNTMTPPRGPLNGEAWFNILHTIGRQNQSVRLDLRDMIFEEGNTNGGLVEVFINDGTLFDEDGNLTRGERYITFDPVPTVAWGKDKIVSIILPDVAQMINQAVENIDIVNNEDIDDIKSRAAFRHFTNLRSVTAANVTHIGNFAFVDRVSLMEVNFPRVGHTVTPFELADPTNSMSDGFRVDIGDYAFMGCTGLKSVTFNSAAVIGRSAFKDCTDLSSITFPVVWMIGQNAFEGCTSLTEIRFERATKIHDEAFKDCTSLKRVNFDADPERFTSGSPLLGGSVVYDSVIFYPSVFSGCTALEIVDIRRAWNVYFYEGVFEKTVDTFNLYLFDEPDSGARSYGHPQNTMFLGTGQAISISGMFIYVPEGGEKVGRAPNNIDRYISTTYHFSPRIRNF